MRWVGFRSAEQKLGLELVATDQASGFAGVAMRAQTA
jgi:hypothetical protein